MKLFPLNKNSIALISVGIITVGFFVAGLFEVLDYFIIKSLLFAGFATLIIIAFWHGIKNEVKKNRLEDNPQDDLN